MIVRTTKFHKEQAWSQMPSPSGAHLVGFNKPERCPDPDCRDQSGRFFCSQPEQQYQEHQAGTLSSHAEGIQMRFRWKPGGIPGKYIFRPRGYSDGIPKVFRGYSDEILGIQVLGSQKTPRFCVSLSKELSPSCPFIILRVKDRCGE